MGQSLYFTQGVAMHFLFQLSKSSKELLFLVGAIVVQGVIKELSNSTRGDNGKTEVS